MENVLVSVLMTAYNREKYIGAAIESVLASTYTNFELIITDDQSKDTTVDIARSFAEKDSRVKVYINKTNLGDYHNRNQAAAYAKGKYIKYLDADDYIYPHGLELMIYYLEQAERNNIALAVFSLEQDRKEPYPIVLSPEEIYRKHFNNAEILATAPCSTILNREIFLKEGGFSGKKMVGDIEMWLKLAARYNTLLMPGHHCWYRVHEQQEINTFNNFRGDYYNVSTAALTGADCPLGEEEKQACLRRVNNKFSRLMLHFLIKKRNIRLFRLNAKSANTNLFKIVTRLFK